MQCLSGKPCDRLPYAQARDAALPSISETASYQQVQALQQAMLAAEPVLAYAIQSLGDIDHLAKLGLQTYERLGLNPYMSAVVAAKPSDYYSGIWPREQSIVDGVKAGASFVTKDTSRKLRLSASFDTLDGEASAGAANVLDVAPEGPKTLSFVARINQAKGSDLSGNLQRRIIAVASNASCSVVTDSHFDEAHASAYFLVIKNTAATAPVWYLPPRG